MATAKGADIWRGQVRMPRPMAEWVKERASTSFRSTNAEFVEIIREAMRMEAMSAAHPHTSAS